jgi:hypothetical protein
MQLLLETFLSKTQENQYIFLSLAVIGFISSRVYYFFYCSILFLMYYSLFIILTTADLCLQGMNIKTKDRCKIAMYELGNYVYFQI